MTCRSLLITTILWYAYIFHICKVLGTSYGQVRQNQSQELVGQPCNVNCWIVLMLVLECPDQRASKEYSTGSSTRCSSLLCYQYIDDSLSVCCDLSYFYPVIPLHTVDERREVF
jgi:hypothetical protein